MIVLLHVIAAIIGLVLAGASVIRPSRNLIRLTAISVATMLASGTYLVIASHAALVPACTSGLLYTVLTLGISAVAYRRLAKVTN